jgi:hypothetical protein
MYVAKESLHLVRNNILLLVMLSTLGCHLGEFSNPAVHYTLPDGYVGVFKIVLDESAGADVKPNGGRYTYEIPDEGILRVKDLESLRQMHEETAAYRNGNRIIIPDSKLSDDTVALRSLGQHTRGKGPYTIVFVIGNKWDADRVNEDLASPEFDNIPPRVYNQRLIER